MKISTVEQMRELDRTAIEKYGIPDLLLMENAGLAVYETVKREIGLAGRRFAVVCGGGNNGGDGFVTARKLHSSGAFAEVIFFGHPEKLKGSAKTNYEICKAAGVSIDAGRDLGRCKEVFRDADAVIDALFGTGLARNIEGEYAELVRLVNSSGKMVFSIDIPSGVGGNTGRVMGVAVQADYTVTFGLPKLGTILYPGAKHCGRLFVTHISFPPQHYNGKQIQQAENLPVPLPQRNPEGHKGSFGRVLCIAGSSSYYGAPLFCSRSFLKAGGGYSRLAAPASIVPVLAGNTPEVVYHPLSETKKGRISSDNAAVLEAIISGESAGGTVDIVVFGPGLGVGADSVEMLEGISRCTDDAGLPLVIDGDGLRTGSERRQLIAERNAPTILTPHPGEMAQLLDMSVAEISRDPVSAARKCAKAYNTVCVLKGARSCIAVPDGMVWINTSGNSGMGTAGSGDVLSGTIPALYCLGLQFPDAVRAGVYIHGLAGDIAAEWSGEDGITAEDICEALPEALRRYRYLCSSAMVFGHAEAGPEIPPVSKKSVITLL